LIPFRATVRSLSVCVSAFGSIRARGDAILQFLSFPLEGVFLDLDFFYSSAGLSNFDVTAFREGEDYYDRVLCVGGRKTFFCSFFFLSSSFPGVLELAFSLADSSTGFEFFSFFSFWKLNLRFEFYINRLVSKPVFPCGCST
jgi:hypothetical protein